MSEVIEAPSKKVQHQAAERCPFYDEDCTDVRDPVSCWSYGGDGHPFPGVCPFVFGMENTND